MRYPLIIQGYGKQLEFTRDWTPFKLIQEGYKVNPAVHASVGLWTVAFAEPKPKLYDTITGDPLPAEEPHPLRDLLKQPNPYQDWDEFRRVTISNRLCTGNCYIVKSRDPKTQKTVALYPYHDGWITPIPTPEKWIAKYRYNNGARQGEDIPVEDVIHLKWFQPDPEAPWRGFSPLMALGRDIDTGVAQMKLTLAAMNNGAMPGTVVTIPQPKEGQQPITAGLLQRLKQQFEEKFSGQSFGKSIFLEDGMDIKQMSMNFQQMDMTNLYDIPEAHVCAVLFTPIGVVGLSAGLKNSTYSNREGDMRIWTEQRLIPMWAADDSALTRCLGNEYDKPVRIEHDVKNVYALRENDAKNEVATMKLYASGIISHQEARTRIGLDPETDPGAIFYKGPIVKGDNMPAQDIGPDPNATDKP